MTQKPKKTRPKLPPWIRVRISRGESRKQVDELLKNLKLHTVCESARCPNLGECWHRHTATFMILGNACTRNCKFCAVAHEKNPAPPEPDEPDRVAEAAAKMNLKYVVVTSVTRDDLPLGGSEQFAAVITKLKERIPDVKVEVLTPDFNADVKALKIVIDAKPDVFNHNIETVERLTPLIRDPHANYRRSLQVLSAAKELGKKKIPIKSGLMVGLGETDEEIETALRDLHAAGVEILTIGQYLPPTLSHWPVKRYITPEEFDSWRDFALKLGFSNVASAPLVRSSYQAEMLMNTKRG